MFLIGTDEAGYGPNLGPLVISMTIWEVPDAAAERDLYDLLGDVVVKMSSDVVASRIAIADSKQLYKPGGGLASLERGVLSTLQTRGRACSTWREVWAALAPGSLSSLGKPPWYESFDRTLPMDAQKGEIHRLASALADVLASAGITLRDMQSVALSPLFWNEQLDVHQNKASVLANET
ncbi:MAG: hypothetical protein ACC628_08830, partial [Pirellulaceae bacterium]